MRWGGLDSGTISAMTMFTFNPSLGYCSVPFVPSPLLFAISNSQRDYCGVGCTLGGCHRLGVSIQGHTDRGVSQQFLHYFQIRSHGPKQCGVRVPEGMPSDALGDPQLLGNRADAPAHQLLSPVRIFSAATRTGKHPMLRLLVGVLLVPALQGLDQVLVKWNGLLRGLGLAGADHLTYHRSRHSEFSDFEINILPLQTELFALSQSGAYVQEH